jgi:hypothetical protein
VAFSGHFYGRHPIELLGYKSRDVAYWYEQAVEVHNALNKAPEE